LLCPHVFSAYRHISSAQEYIRLVYHESGGADLPLILEKNKERDAQYGQTQQGPHRDDLLIFLNDREASLFASEGQQRTIAIALKLAQSSLLTEETGYIPIHLIDDVFGELDPSRRMAFLQALPKEAQCLITTTHLDWLQGTSCPIPTFRLEASHLTPM
jgi:DNA replication and repair protein RecF